MLRLNYLPCKGGSFMILRMLVGVVVLSHLIFPQPASAQDLQTSIVGVWKLSNFTRKDVQTGQVTNVFGEQPVGYLTYTKAGRIFALLVGTDRKSPASTEPSDSERVELFKSMVG